MDDSKWWIYIIVSVALTALWLQDTGRWGDLRSVISADPTLYTSPAAIQTQSSGGGGPFGFLNNLGSFLGQASSTAAAVGG